MGREIVKDPQQAVGHRRSVLLEIRRVLPLVVVTLILSCVGGPPSSESGRETAPTVSGKVPVEAYLFDVVIHRHGKPTSLRLDVFDADSVIALGGRAYLGKGALRARLTKDSLIAYFPISDEFFSEDFSSFSMSGENPIDLSKLGFLSLLKQPPDTGALNDSVRVDILSESTDNAERLIHSGPIDPDSLKWRISVKYFLTEGRFRLGRFSYFDSTMTITANRREYRSRARIPADRFRVTIPPTAVRVTP